MELSHDRPLPHARLSGVLRAGGLSISDRAIFLFSPLDISLPLSYTVTMMIDPHTTEAGMNNERNRMDVRDRFENDPQFHALVEMITAWLLAHPDFTPTELREAAMLAAARVDMMTMKEFRFDRLGNLLQS